MRQVDALLEEYGESHQNPTNKLIHWVCVPAIFFSTVGLVYSIPLGPLAGLVPDPEGAYLNWASLALALTTLWYFRMSIPLAVGMVGVSVGMLGKKSPSPSFSSRGKEPVRIRILPWQD